jgi:hypothetical protein
MGTELGTTLRARLATPREVTPSDDLDPEKEQGEQAMKTLPLKAWLAAGFAGILSVGVVTTPALAHHSFAMYDQTKTKTLTGKLTRFVLGANHAQLIFEVLGPDGKPELDANGKPVVWGVETGSAKSLAGAGVTVESFPYGTILTVSLMPLRDGRNFGAMTLTGGTLIGCGATMPEGGCTEKTGKVYLGGRR